MDVLLKDPLTPEWFKGYAERRGLELILANDQNVAAHLLAMKFSEVTPMLKTRGIDPATERPFIAILYKRPVPLATSAAALTQRHAS